MSEKMNLVWATDENYVFLAGTSITSVMESKNKDDFFHVWILADNISENSKDKFFECAHKYDFELTILDMKDLLDIIRKTGARTWGSNRSLSAYSRLFIAQLMKNRQEERVLYCDCDLIVNGSLKSVYFMDMGEKRIGMVRNYDRVEIRDLIGIDYDEPYYNSGFMIIDIDKWIAGECQERILEHMNNVRASYPFVDQDLINSVMHTEIFDLPLKYNVNPRVVQYSFKQLCKIYGMNEKNFFGKTEYDNVHKGDIVVYHCSDPAAGKPWEIGNRHIYFDIWYKYFQKSLWKETVLEQYHPIYLSKINRLMEIALPQCIYIFFLRKASKYMMKKMVHRYM